MARLIALGLPPGPVFVEHLRRVWEAGDAVLPIDHRLPPPAVERLVEALGPEVVVSAEGERRGVRGRAVADGDALVMSTSGTTGEPKGVVLTHEAVAASARATSARLGIDPDRHHWLCCLPVAHVGGLGVVTRALWSGTALTVLPRFDVAAVAGAVGEASAAGTAGRAVRAGGTAGRAARAVGDAAGAAGVVGTAPRAASGADGGDGGATHVSVVVSMLAQLPDGLVSRFERIVLGGSAVPAELPPNVVATYGLTETGSGCVYGGEPLDGVEVRVDADGQILLRGALLLRAYRTAAGETDPFVEGGWFPTGDLGAWDAASGRLSVFGRRGDLIISGGQNVWPEPVERVLAAVPGVAEVAVVGRPDARWGSAVTAVVVPSDPSRPPSLAALRSAVKEQLAPYCAPHRLELAAALPRTALGKVRRNAL
jgi:O-succinylbenzoic acid--CoA ligase